MAEAAIAETYRPEYTNHQPLHEGIRSAGEFIDRETIEVEAWQLIEARRCLPMAETRYQERRDNARTALMEALTASGHLSKVEIHGTLEEINAQVLARLLNGWDETLPTHEQHRRFAEICNELVIQKIHRAIVAGLLPPDTEVLEISDHPEALTGHHLGYRDSNRKGMVRSTGLRTEGYGGYTRVIEQISRSNGTWQSTFSFMGSCGAQLRDGPTDIAALETPQIYSRYDYANGAVDIMRKLDWHVGPGVLYGDSGERARNHPAYEQLRTESARREQDVLAYVDDLALLEGQLDRLFKKGQIDWQERQQILGEEIIRVLDAICTLDPSYAEDTFGKASVALFEEVAILSAQGRYEEAAFLLESNNYLKQTVTFCGMTISLEEAKTKGLEVNSFGELVEKGKESWKWKQGVCVVKTCSTRPGKTEVGPCSVCRKCQKGFDKGKDPTKFKTSQKTSNNVQFSVIKKSNDNKAKSVRG